MKTVLLTGANGYIGKHVVEALQQAGAAVIALNRSASATTFASKCVAANIFDPVEGLLEAIGCIPDACLHLAWRDGFNHNSPAHMEDVSRHFSFLTDLQKAGVNHIAVMGSMHEVGYWEGAIDENTPCNPQSLYGVAKNALRQALDIEFANTNTVFQWLRGYYIYGDDSNAQSIFGKLLRAARDGETTFPFTSGKNLYDFLPVDKLAAQIAAVVMQDEVTGIINCCSGNPVSLADQIEGFIAKNNLSIALEYGAFPDRPYDSPGVWGDATRINGIFKAAT